MKIVGFVFVKNDFYKKQPAF